MDIMPLIPQIHIIATQEIGQVRHPAKRTAGKRRVNIEEATGYCYKERNSLSFGVLHSTLEAYKTV